MNKSIFLRRINIFVICLLITSIFSMNISSASIESESKSDATDLSAKDNEGRSNGQAANSNPLDGFEQITSNSNFTMYFDETEFIIAIKDNASEMVWYTSPMNRENIKGLTGAGRLAAGSQLIVDYFDKDEQTQRSVNSLLGSIKQKTAKMTKLASGIHIDYDFSRKLEGFSIPVEFILTDKGLDARILFSGIKEYSNVIIKNISLIPYFGAGTTEDKGYMLVPDGSGSIIDFNTGRAGMNSYSQDVYGRDMALSTVKKDTISEFASLPVFGVNKNGHGFIAIIDEGAGESNITAVPSGILGPLNYAYASFTYRNTDSVVLADSTWTPRDVVLIAKSVTPLPSVGISIRFLPDSSSNITGMAQNYRNYIEEAYGLKRLADNKVYSYAELYGAIKKNKSFIGIKYDAVQPMTTFSECEDIATQLSNEGIDNIIFKYNGILKGGMNGKAPIKADFERKLGGNKGLANLVKSAKEKGFKVFPDVEFIRIYEGRFGWWPFNITAKNITLSPIVDFQYKLSTLRRDVFAKPAYIVSPDKIAKEVKSFTESVSKYDIGGISVSSFGNTAYSNYATGKMSSKSQTSKMIHDSMKLMKDKLGSVMTDTGFEYAIAVADHVFKTPVTDSKFDVTTSRVPFYQMVFSGYVNLASVPLNLTSNYSENLLLCIETGTNPAFVFTYEDTVNLANTEYEKLVSTKFSDWKSTVSKYYKEFATIYNGVGDKRYKDYKIITPNVRLTEYMDGTQIIVNYGNNDVNYNGVPVKAKGYIVFKYGKKLG